MTEEKAKKKNTGKIVGLVLGILAAVMLVLGLLPFVVPLKQVSKFYTVELGSDVSTEISDYVSGFAPAVWVAKLDISGVKASKLGEYKATVKQGFYTYEYDIWVEDTTAPTLKFYNKDFYLEENESYDANYFVEEISDFSNDVSVLISENGSKSEKYSNVCIEESGVYVLTFWAKDPSGNKSEYTLSVTVDTAPTITGMKDYYVVPGTTLNYLEFIKAEDTVDGDVTENLRVNAGDVDLSSKGSYELIYICEDSYGLSSEEKVSVNVMDAIDIQELINTHEIHRLEEIIVGAYNLYDIGVYNGKTMEEMYEIMHPTAVRIAPGENSYGSGFVLKVTDEEIILGTCQHVVKNNSTAKVSFFDGTTVKGTVEGTVYNYDLAFVSVNLSDISTELLNQLYTVHIDKGYWDELDNEADLEVGIRCINDKGSVWRDRKGKLIYKSGTTDLMWRDLPQVTRVSTQFFHGASGSAVFDIHGNFMGVATYIITGAGRYENYASTVETFCNAYEQIFESEAYYQ